MAFSPYFLTFSAPPPLPPIVTDHSRQPPPPQHQEEDKRTPPPLAPIRERYSPQEETPPAISLRKVSPLDKPLYSLRSLCDHQLGRILSCWSPF